MAAADGLGTVKEASRARCRRSAESPDSSTVDPSIVDAFVSQPNTSQPADRSEERCRATAAHHSGTSTR